MAYEDMFRAMSGTQFADWFGRFDCSRQAVRLLAGSTSEVLPQPAPIWSFQSPASIEAN